ncbi:unnamed protein product [Trichogramma brassicae]|uniref:PHTF1/2 N-terminal domain-containing protein n=1 Tax=Trichogramma brassicae TaxID=86971 RepID=A0A6H5J1L1_9HYME|nr:unnamed protein product [Trichogramma brassicae]
MTMDQLLIRYQKKLGTYDKQEWEKTVEQKIFLGLKHVPMRAAKLKTEFIDVDLVRGSSFPKAKPKHGLVTVAYLAIQRLLFLPFTADWWIQQTSSSIYFFFLLLYFLQVFNLYLYFYHYPKDNKSDIVSMSEVLVPAVMMITLSMIHSQIVSTNSGAKIINKYDKKQVRKIRHGRSRLNKNRGKKNSNTNNEEHHEDDGFESLNGNASSDNDRETSCVRGEENLLNLSDEKDNSSIRRRRPRDLIVSCTIWTYRDVKKAELSVLDISSTIIARVESMPESMDYFYIGLFLSIILSLVPSLIRVSDYCGMELVSSTNTSLLATEFSIVNPKAITEIIFKFIRIAFGSSPWIRSVILLSAMERFFLAFLLFFLLAVAERTFKQRLLYAKLFSHLTSSRRARKSELPHFRLNKVRNIKTWLSVRSYLKRRGPQRSVDVIISSVFVMTLALLSYVSLELIKDIDNLHSHYNIEALMWSFALGLFILRFMTLGTKINNKYRNLSILITEQINLYLQIEQKPHKKEELTVANNVLKLAADLIKELESPFKISGLSANPYLYTITKVVLLSALSGVLSELLGFKLKLHKIKIK